MNIFHCMYSKLKQNDFIHSVAVLLSGTAVSQIVIVALTPLLTRLYPPETFGVLSVYLSLMLPIGVLTSLHYESAIPLPEKDSEALNLLALSLFVLLINVFLSIGFFSFVGQPLIASFGIKGMEQIILFLPLSIFGFGLFQIFQLWMLRKEDYPQIAKGRVRMNVTQFFFQIGLGVTTGTSSGLIAGEVIGRIIGGGGMAHAAWKNIRHTYKYISFQAMWNMAIRYRRFPLLASWSSILNGLTQHLPTLFIAYSLGAKAAGLYLIANRLLALPDALIGYSVKQVYIAKSAKVIHRSLPEFTSFFWSTTKRMGLISAAVYIPATLFLPFFLPSIFGEDWGDVGIFVQCLSLLFFFQLIVGPISANFNLLEQQYMQVLCEGIRLSLLVTGIIISQLFFEETWQVVLSLSIAGSLGTMVVGFFSWYVLHRQQEKWKSAGGGLYGSVYRKQ